MADYFVDSTTGDNGDNGTTMDLAWATLEYALISGGLTAGDILWVRRVHSEIAGQISLVGTGTAKDFIQVIGWPRNTASITGATWVQGSTTVDNIAGLSMDREKHLGRYITGPDGNDYIISKVNDSDTITIGVGYFGSSQSGANGAATIKADEDYALAQAINDSGWTITKSDYNSDADDVPTLDFGGAGVYIYHNNDDHWRYANIEIKGAAGYGNIRSANADLIFEGCLLYQDNDNSAIYSTGQTIYIYRGAVTGNSTGTSQRGLTVLSGGSIVVKDTPVYGFGDHGMYLGNVNVAQLDNVNVGVEESNGDDDIGIYTSIARFMGRNVKLGGTNGDVVFVDTTPGCHVRFENYNRIVGAHKTFTPQGTLTKVDVFGGAGDPEKRPGGADSVLEVLYNTAQPHQQEPRADTAFPIFTHEFEVNTESKNYRYYVQTEGAITSSDHLFIEIEYISHYGSTSRYLTKRVRSDELFSARSGADDWSQYMEVTGIQPAAFGLSKVIIRCYCTYYHSSNKIYIDPNPEIT